MTHHGPLSRRERVLVLCICSMSLLIVGLDVTIVNVALPSIRQSFHASVSGLQWTIDAYALAIASLLMLAGSTADRVGRRRTFQTGLVVFSIGSLLCGIAPSLGFLIAARIVQAVGGAMLNPVAMSIVRNVFEDPRERAQAIGIWGAMFGISLALGPIIGGALVDSIGWRAVFFVNLPVGLLVIVLTTMYVPESRAPHPRRIDPVGQVLVIAALSTLTYGIIEGRRAGWLSAEILTVFGVSIASFISLIAYELRRREPLLEVRFFRSAPFSGASAIAIFLFAGIGGFLFLNTLYLQSVRGLSPFEAGLYTLPMAGSMLIFAPLSGRVMSRVGTRPSLVIGGAAVTIAGLMLTQITRTTAPAYLFVAYAAFGIGSGLVNPPITNTAISGMPPAQAGVAAAVASTSRQVGTTLGVAILGAVAARGLAASGTAATFATGTHAGWWIVVVLGLAVAGLGLLTTTGWAAETAHRTAALFAEPARVPVVSQ